MPNKWLCIPGAIQTPFADRLLRLFCRLVGNCPFLRQQEKTMSHQGLLLLIGQRSAVTADSQDANQPKENPQQDTRRDGKQSE